MTNSNMFEKASRQKLRWTIKGVGGEFTAEDLWSVDKVHLNTAAQELDAILAVDGQKTDYLAKRKKDKPVNAEVKLKRDIVVYIIQTKVAEEEAKKEARLATQRNREEKEKIIAALEGKADAQLQKKSATALMARLKELEELD